MGKCIDCNKETGHKTLVRGMGRVYLCRDCLKEILKTKFGGT